MCNRLCGCINPPSQCRPVHRIISIYFWAPACLCTPVQKRSKELLHLWVEFGQITSFVPPGCSPAEEVTTTTVTGSLPHLLMLSTMWLFLLHLIMCQLTLCQTHTHFHILYCCSAFGCWNLRAALSPLFLNRITQILIHFRISCCVLLLAFFAVAWISHLFSWPEVSGF